MWLKKISNVGLSEFEHNIFQMPWNVFADLVYNSIMYVYYIFGTRESIQKEYPQLQQQKFRWVDYMNEFFISSVFERGSYPNGRITRLKIPKEVTRRQTIQYQTERTKYNNKQKGQNTTTNRKDKIQ